MFPYANTAAYRQIHRRVFFKDSDYFFSSTTPLIAASFRSYAFAEARFGNIPHAATSKLGLPISFPSESK